tara:strand:+ start:228 stop:488 length:261 start_codon:yes stop_codon:yes gene_type:complete
MNGKMTEFSKPKYDRYHISHKCSSIDLRLQELRDARFDCDITRSVIVQHKEIKDGMILDRENVIDIMKGPKTPTKFSTVRKNGTFM